MATEIIDDGLDHLSDEELLELEALESEEDMYQKRLGLTVFSDNTPKNYRFLYESVMHQRYENDKLVAGKKGVVLEGSARSRKTFSVIDMLINIGLNVNRKLVCTIIKETYNEVKTTLHNDFELALDEFGLDNPFARLQEVKSFKIGKLKIQFIGADQENKFRGLVSDIVYFNEAIPISKEVFRQATMRCSWFWVIDYNPSVTQHWIFKSVIPRPDVGFLRTTFLDNPLVPIGQKLEILAYEPWRPGSYKVMEGQIFYKGKLVDETNQPPPHPENIQNGTADEFNWKVFGLGLRGMMEGIIFKNVEYIHAWPEDLPFDYGLDFGFTVDPCAITKNWEDETTIWIELLSYHPMETADEIDEYARAIGMDVERLPTTADSADKFVSAKNGTQKMIADLKKKGWKIEPVSKTKNVMYHLLNMKKKKIKIVMNHLVDYAKVEQENYIMREINGVKINQPIDAFNHMWDSARYRHMTYSRDPGTFKTAKTIRQIGINY